MSAASPLVAGPVDTATPFSGAGLLDSGTQLADAIASGSWIEGGLAAFSVAVDTVATAVDPLGSLIGAGLGWLMDHFEPLKAWLNDFTGDAGEVQGFAQTWTNISQQLHASGDELLRVLGDVDELAGEAMDAYRRFQADAAAHLHGAGDWANAMGVGLGIASTIVQIVHDLVRDTIAQLVGSAISWAAEAVFTLGLATPVIVGQVTSRVASLSSRIGKYVTKAIEASRRLAKHLDSLKALTSRVGDLFERVLKGGGGTPRRPVSGQGATPSRIPPLDVSDPASVRVHSVHNPDSSSAMLGKWDPDHPELRYTSKAEAGGHSYFSIDEWDAVKDAQGLDDAGMFDRYNIPFLEDQAAAGKPIHFSHMPVDDGSALAAELRWLRSHGYEFDADTMTAVPVD